MMLQGLVTLNWERKLTQVKVFLGMSSEGTSDQRLPFKWEQEIVLKIDQFTILYKKVVQTMNFLKLDHVWLTGEKPQGHT